MSKTRAAQNSESATIHAEAQMRLAAQLSVDIPPARTIHFSDSSDDRANLKEPFKIYFPRGILRRRFDDTRAGAQQSRRCPMPLPTFAVVIGPIDKPFSRGHDPRH
jgi:hypothetical protein